MALLSAIVAIASQARSLFLLDPAEFWSDEMKDAWTSELQNFALTVPVGLKTVEGTDELVKRFHRLPAEILSPLVERSRTASASLHSQDALHASS